MADGETIIERVGVVAGIVALAALIAVFLVMSDLTPSEPSGRWVRSHWEGTTWVQGHHEGQPLPRD